MPRFLAEFVLRECFWGVYVCKLASPPVQPAVGVSVVAFGVCKAFLEVKETEFESTAVASYYRTVV